MELFEDTWEEPWRTPTSARKMRVAVARLRQATHLEIAGRPGGGYFLAQPRAVYAWEPQTRITRIPELPCRPGALIGRQDEMGRATVLIAEHPLVTVVGTAGVGKTRLATELAWELTELFRGRVWVCSLADVRGPTELALAVGMRTGADGADPMGVVGEGVALLVLDNLEQLTGPSVRLLATWMEAAPGLTAPRQIRIDESGLLHQLQRWTQGTFECDPVALGGYAGEEGGVGCTHQAPLLASLE